MARESCSLFNDRHSAGLRGLNGKELGVSLGEAAEAFQIGVNRGDIALEQAAHRGDRLARGARGRVRSATMMVK